MATGHSRSASPARPGVATARVTAMWADSPATAASNTTDIGRKVELTLRSR